MALREYILHNFWLKIFSLFLAGLIWVTIRIAIQKEISNQPPNSDDLVTNVFPRLPVGLLTSPSDPRKFTCDPPEVTVIISGDAQLMRHVRSQDIEVFVKLMEIRQAVKFLKKLQFYLPPGVALVRIQPSTVMVEDATAGMTNAP